MDKASVDTAHARKLEDQYGLRLFLEYRHIETGRLGVFCGIGSNGLALMYTPALVRFSMGDEWYCEPESLVQNV